MEKAIFTNNLDHVTDDFNRLYFGTEFCENLIPPLRQLKQTISFVKQKNIKLTFVTPYVTDEGIKKLKPLLIYLSSNYPCEIVINDFGVLNILQANLKPVLGRLLVKQKSGPRIALLASKLPGKALKYFQQSYLDVKHTKQFLESKGIGRIELNNTLQPIKINSFRKSLYLPYTYVSTTRLCVTKDCEYLSNRKKVVIGKCRKECLAYTFKLEHPSLPTPLYLKGNTQFYLNKRILKIRGLDRIVYVK